MADLEAKADTARSTTKDKPASTLNDDAKSVGAGSTSQQIRSPFAVLRKVLFDSAEARGVEPVPVDERTDKRGLSLFTLWFAANCTLLPVSTGMSGTLIFGMGLGATSAIIVVATLLAMLPVAWMGMMGPKTGLRQIIQTRYYFGYHFVLIIALLQLATLAGYCVITGIVGGQTLAALSGGSLDQTGAIAIVSLCALPVSFMGYRFLHYFQMYAWIPSLIAMVIAVGAGGKDLSRQVEAGAPAVRPILTFASLCASLGLSWAGLVSDFSVYISPTVPRYRIFAFVYAGYCIPSILLLILGAAIGGAVPNVASWSDANDAFSVGGVMYAMVSSIGGFGKFVAILLALSVVGLNACSFYSLSISLQSLHPMLLRIPRYIYAIVVCVIVFGVSIAAASNFYDSLSNFLGIVGYWTAGYAGIALTDSAWFRKGDYASYDPHHWNMRRELPTGLSALAALIMSFGLIVPCMDTVWYAGWFASRIGDIGVEVGVCSSAFFYLVLRTLEIRIAGRG